MRLDENGLMDFTFFLSFNKVAFYWHKFLYSRHKRELMDKRRSIMKEKGVT